MSINRREFVTLPAAAVAGALYAAPSNVPWQRKVRRVGQINMTEHDPVALNVEEWADYWASLKVDAVLVSVTGILAFYQTKVPFHKKGKYLGERDFFGDCCAAAKKRGLRVIARMSPDLNWEDAVKAHPEWFQHDAQGAVMRHTEDPRLFRTCMFTTYMTDYMTAIMREINSMYDVDAMFTNAWPPLGRMPVCYCDQCRRLPKSGTPEYWDKFNERTVYLWKLYDSIAKEKHASNFYFANLGGGIGSTADLKQLGAMCEWFQRDNQGRGGQYMEADPMPAPAPSCGAAAVRSDWWPGYSTGRTAAGVFVATRRPDCPVCHERGWDECTYCGRIAAYKANRRGLLTDNRSLRRPK